MNYNLIKCFEDTLNLCESTDLRFKTEEAKNSSKVYHESFFTATVVQNRKADILVEDTTTFVAAACYRSLGKVAVLNFANPEVPGGGVRNGAVAQEECLCRCSNLYPCLITPAVYDDFYGYHYKYGRFLYSDRIIYTSNVTVFKSDDLNLLEREQWFDVDVMTCAAPLLSKAEYISDDALYNLFKSRIKNIFNVAVDNAVDVLILGAFGCGAFRNPPDIVAKAFRAVIDENNYGLCFKKIIFAIKNSTDDPSKTCPNLEAFRYAFANSEDRKNCRDFADAYESKQSDVLTNLPSGQQPEYSEELTEYLKWKSENKFSGKKFSVLGDSISTLEGYNPKGYNLFFTGEICQKAGVLDINDTWWGRVIDFFGGELLVNNSWSGSQVSKVLNKDSLFPSACSHERTGGLHSDDIKPDVILIFLGMNDWARAMTPTCNRANRRHNEWEYVFELSYEEMIKRIRNNYPSADIYCCTLCTTYMSKNPSFIFPKEFGGIHIEKYNSAIKEAVKNQNCKLVDLYKYNQVYDTIDGTHPNKNGMNTLATLVLREMLDESETAFLKLKFSDNEAVYKKQNISHVARHHIDTRITDDGYVRRNTDETTELFPDILKLTNIKLSKDIEIHASRVSVGRQENCGLFFDTSTDPNYKYIGRQHAEFLYERQTWYLRDNNSANGTWLNGRKAEPGIKYELLPGDEIIFAVSEEFIFYKKQA